VHWLLPGPGAAAVAGTSAEIAPSSAKNASVVRFTLTMPNLFPKGRRIVAASLMGDGIVRIYPRFRVRKT
jgi:hypothetical protein